MTRFVALLGPLALPACTDARPVASAPEPPSDVRAGALAPDFAGRDVSGRAFRLGEHLGRQVVLLDFWATFCEPCKADLARLGDLYERDAARGLLVVAVAMDGPESSAEVRAFVRRFAVQVPVVLDADARIAGVYDPRRAMPRSVLIDRAGRIISVREGYSPADEATLEAEVEAALAAPPGAEPR